MEVKIFSKEHKCYKYSNIRNQKPFYFYVNIYAIYIYATYITQIQKYYPLYLGNNFTFIVFIEKSYEICDIIFSQTCWHHFIT